jgi:hypothetical protein
MTYFLYAKPDGYPDIAVSKLDLSIFPGYEYLGEHETLPNVVGKKYRNGVWVWGGVEPEYEFKRRKAYPRPQELFEALWQAMDAGVLPKVAGFYDKIDEVKKRFPEE